MNDYKGVEHKTVSIYDLIPHERNYNKHPQEQIERVKASLRRFGQVDDAIVKALPDNKYKIVAHECVTTSALQLLQAGECPHLERWNITVVPAHWTALDVEGYMAASNETARLSEPDTAELAALLQEQQDAGFDLASLGSSDESLRQMLEVLGDEWVGESERDEEDNFEVDPDTVEIRCKRGELWAMGNHRLLVDDSTKVENVRRLMQGEKAILMATDPPYGDSWVQKARDMQAHGYVHSHAGLHGSIESDDLNVADLKAFLVAFLEAAKLAGDPPMPFYVWHRAKRIVFEQALIEAGYFVHQPVVWVKPGFVIGRLHYHPRCEWALHGWRKGNGKCPFYGERNQSDVWEVERENDKIHPTQKPLLLFETPILNHTQEGEICYEPFAGSGTQVIAAERLGRRCYAMELDEKYATIILNRWEQHTGQSAQLIARVEEGTHV